MTQVVVSFSGGKDSLACLLIALERGVENLTVVFADTGNEHQQTLDFVQQVSEELHPVTTVKADFAQQIKRKREFINTKWREQGISEKKIDAALSVLHPTGNPFLDLCLWKGRFPSRRAQFCTAELKINPIYEQIILPLLDDNEPVESWQGVRRDESRNRAFLPEHEMNGDLKIYRPIIDWSADRVVQYIMGRYGKINPLYRQGMGRVGCMPCVNVGKTELSEIAQRFPEEVERIKTWERLVSNASKCASSTMLPTNNITADANVNYQTHGIEQQIAWAKTSRGGKQFDLFAIGETSNACASAYGLCE